MTKDKEVGNNKADELTGPSGAPELDPKFLDDKRKAEIDAAFSVESDADVVVDMSEEEKPKPTLPVAGEQPVTDARPVTPTDGGNGLRRFFHGYWRHKLWTMPLTVVALIGAVLAIPLTRYQVLGLFLKQDIIFTVTDEVSKQPVASAVVELDGQKGMTDNEGVLRLRARVGDRETRVSKRYYQESVSAVFVPISPMNIQREIRIKATGRQVPLAVVNKLSGRPVENVTLKAAGTEVKTDKDGKAILVLPADKPEQTVELSAEKFNTFKTTLRVTEQSDPKNRFQVTPSGKVYFLSRLSGRIDLVKTDLDGAQRQTVVAGTGREEERNTILLASRDWKYLAFLSRRDNDRPKLYLVDTTTDKMTVMDEGDVSFQLVGWSDYNFVYRLSRNSVKAWEPKREVLKSFSASVNKASLLDESSAAGNQNDYYTQGFSNLYLAGNRLVYSAVWDSYTPYGGEAALKESKSHVIRSVAAVGGDRKDLRAFAFDKYYGFNGRLYAPSEIYFNVYNQESRKTEIYEYQSGTIKMANVNEDDFYNKDYPTFLTSPSGMKTFWNEQRDGRDTFFTGDKAGGNAKQVTALNEHQVYGWYSDDYLLVSKKGSELFIMPADGSKVTKITDYHRPNASFRGYGGGYGGL